MLQVRLSAPPGDRQMQQKACARESMKRVWPLSPVAEAAPRAGVRTVRSGCAGSASLVSGSEGLQSALPSPCSGSCAKGPGPRGPAQWAPAVGRPGSGLWAVSFTAALGSLPARQHGVPRTVQPKVTGPVL